MSTVQVAPDDRIARGDVASVLRRLCEHLGIAFSANKIFPSLADLQSDDGNSLDVDQLNSVGKHFGVRFREMSGTARDILNAVNDSGPVIVRRQQGLMDDDQPSVTLILGTSLRGKLLINESGEDRVEPARWVRQNLRQDDSGQYRWLLVQPILAAEHASRFHYLRNEQPGPLTPLQRFLGFLKPEAQDVRTIFIFSVIIGILSLTTPLAVEAVVNTIAFGRYLQPLIVLSLIVLVFLGFRAALNVLMTIVTEVIQRKLFVRTVEDLAYRLTRVPLATWKNRHGPELVNRFFDIVTVQKVTSKLLLETLMLALQTVIGLSVLAFYHPFLLGYDIGLLIMMTVILWFIGRKAIQTAKDESQLKYETAAWLQEIVRHPTTFKFNGGLGYAINRSDELTAQYINSRQQHFSILIRQISFAMAMQVIAATVLLALGGYLVIVGEMTLGQLVAAELIVTVILGSFAKIGKDLESFYDLMASIDKLGTLFDLPVEPIDKLQSIRRPGAYDLQLIGVQLNSAVNSTCNLTFSANETHAIYGNSELLRRRLIDSLIGQDKPDQGYILVDDYRIDAIAAESLQRKISLVREIELFEATVAENLRMGRKDIGSSQINEIVEKLGMRKTLATLPDDFNTSININGYPLSQGQAVRLVLARAIVSKPGVLIIDSLLDRLSDDDIEDLLPRLNSVLHNTTIIVATGRRSIATWAMNCLEVDQPTWTLSKFND
ncbi:MAG: ATP-binding cassette domain-containing protein [Planctomycetota bacterium]